MDARSTPLAVGDLAPDFSLRDQHGAAVTLSAGLDAAEAVVVFFPFAFSGICTGELREIRDHLEDFDTSDIRLFAVSCDPMFSLRAWADLEGYFFPLVSDFWPHGHVSSAYGVFDAKLGCAQRGTFLIGRDSRVAYANVEPASTRRDFSGYREALARVRALRGTSAT